MSSIMSSTLRSPGAIGLSPTRIWPRCSPRCLLSVAVNMLLLAYRVSRAPHAITDMTTDDVFDRFAPAARCAGQGRVGWHLDVDIKQRIIVAAKKSAFTLGGDGADGAHEQQQQYRQQGQPAMAQRRIDQQAHM